MNTLSVKIIPGPNDTTPRFLQLHFGEESAPNILQFDTQSAGIGKTKAVDWNAEGKEVVLAAIPVLLVTDAKQRADLEMKDTDELPVLMELIRAEGETRTLTALLDDLENMIQQLPDDSRALASIPRVLAEVKHIQFRAALAPELEYPQYPRPLTIGLIYAESQGQLITIDTLAMDPKITNDSIFEILLEFSQDDAAPEYDYFILLEQLSGFVDDHYNTYNRPTEKVLGLLKQYGLVEPTTTLSELIAQGNEHAKSATTQTDTGAV